MARRYYVIQGQDDLRKIAEKTYGDPELSKKLADYNGIFDPTLLLVGQSIETPSKRELLGRRRRTRAISTELTPPHGLEEVLATFGDIRKYIKEDGTLDEKWESEHLGRARLPFSIPLSWDLSAAVRTLYCHKKLTDIFVEVFTTIEKEGLKDQVKTYGGCYNYRQKRKNTKLSTHSWGIAIDLNPLSRTAQWADITIVDNIIRCMPLLIEEAKNLSGSDPQNLQKIVDSFNNKENLRKMIEIMGEYLRELAVKGIYIPEAAKVFAEMKEDE